jgi:predicted acyl esterase
MRKKIKINIYILLGIILLANISIIPSKADDICKNNNVKTFYQDVLIHRLDDINSLYKKETSMVEMRDGIHLATDVYLPDQSSSTYSSVLVRTPYNKSYLNLGNWADLGWSGIVQDMRGRFASEGIDTVFRNDHTDGPDTLDWIANQSWSNGKIATFGGSALGICQYYMAGANPEHLKCQYIAVATPNLFKHAIYQGGEFRKALIEGWLDGQGSSYILPEILDHENYSLDFWTNVSLEDNWQDVNVPAIHIGGWYDCFAQGIIDGFNGYQYLGGVGALGKSKLIMGPWTHGGFGSTQQGQLTYPENAKDTFSYNIFIEMLKKYVQEESNNYENISNVTYYVMGDVKDSTAPGNFWRYEDSWPPEYQEMNWYFHEDKTLSTTTQDSSNPISYIYDPSNPVPSLGGQNLIIAAGPYDQMIIEDRTDVLVFTSDVLTKPYEATGPIKAKLYVSSDCPDTDFTVKLTDVYPDGRSMLITDGILRMRNRNGADQWEFMQPGEIYEVEVDLWSTSYIWNKNHQIRVAISSSNYPRFLANPNTIDPMYKNTSYNIATNTLYIDSIHPSCIILPNIITNYAPSEPKIYGPNQGIPNVDYEFNIISFDTENEIISYLIDWGDGTNSGWTGFYYSGEAINLQHNWTENSIYKIKAKSKDINNKESDWTTFNINIPRNKTIFNSIIYSLIENHLNLFSNLQKLLNKLGQ